MDNKIRNNGTRNKNIDIVSAHRTMRDKKRDHETMRKRTKSWYVTYDSIMVAVNSVGKHSHFVKTVTTVTAAGAANLYLQNVWRLHGLLRKVMSNHGLQFVAAFMKELYQLLGIKAAMSTTYHPQRDRQTDRMGQPGTGTVPVDLCQRKTG